MNIVELNNNTVIKILVILMYLATLPQTESQITLKSMF